MGYPCRGDQVGAFYHVFNRGLARRAVFERDDERRFFLSLLARGARAGLVRVHAYSLMTNHYHLLLESRGGLSRFMAWSLSRFVRKFNASRRRDGPLFRGRFRARRLGGTADFFFVVRYLDRNAVEAGLVRTPAEYPFASAYHFTRSADRPLWLDRSVIGQLVDFAARSPGAAYLRAFGELDDAAAWLIPRRMALAGRNADAVELLPRLSPQQVGQWLQRQTLADGAARCPVATPTSLAEAVRRGRIEERTTESLDRRRGAPLDEALVGLLRVGAGLAPAEVAKFLGVSASTVARLYAAHRARLAEPSYRARVATILATAVSDTNAVSGGVGV